MVQIKQQIVPQANRHATFGTGNPKKKLVVHQTGNIKTGANAQVHADLQSRGWRNASWHIQSDDKEIIQSWPFEYRLWHASTGNMVNGGNNVGIGWEICINSDGNYLKSLEVAAKGIAKVMKDEGIPMSGLTTHNAEDPNNKWCPAQILSGKDGVNWSDFRAMVQAELNGKPVKPSTAKPQPATPKPTPQPATGKKTLHLPASAKTWRVYKPNGPYTKGNEIHLLTPSAFGGLNYEIKGNPAKDVYLIDTDVKGRVAIYAAPSTGAKITDSKAPVTKPTPKAKRLYLPASAKLWKIYNPKGPYTSGSEIHNLTPSAYGGLTYDIKGNPAPHVYLIDTGVKGRVAIYAHPSTGAVIK